MAAVTKRILLAIAVALATLLGTVPLAAAHAPSAHVDDAPHCYQSPCTWSRTDEDARRQRVQAHGGADVEPGALVAAPLDETNLTVAENVTRDGTRYRVLVTLDAAECGSLARIHDLTLPGYDQLPSRADAILGLDNATDLSFCGQLTAGLPAETSLQEAGGRLRFQTGADAPVAFANGSTNFSLWSGVLGDLSLSVAETSTGVRVDIGLMLDHVATGTLGWGPGDVRVDLLEAWQRTIVLDRPPCTGETTPVGGAELCLTADTTATVDAGPADGCPDGTPAAADTACNAAEESARDARRTVVERTSPARYCPPDQFATCHALAGMAPALAGLGEERADAVQVRSALADEDAAVAAELTTRCTSQVDCSKEVASARFGYNGTADPVPEQTRAEAAGDRAERTQQAASPGGVLRDLACWQNGVQRETCHEDGGDI